MNVYSYVIPGLYKVDAQVVGEVCEKLQESEGGLTPQRLVDASRDPEAETHELFEWRDRIAAENYRIAQAQKVIQSIVCQRDETQPESIERAFVCTPGWKSRYVEMQCALTNAKYKAYLLEQAKRDMEVFTAKYHRLKELAGVVEAMNRARGL